MTVVVKKLGGSVAVVIPKTVAREMELSEGTSLDMTASPSEIVLRKQGRRPRRSMRQIVAQIDPAAYRRNNREFRDDRPVGKEIW
jgi:antitoxin component of MazEF toxin-antitoxin module